MFFFIIFFTLCSHWLRLLIIVTLMNDVNMIFITLTCGTYMQTYHDQTDIHTEINTPTHTNKHTQSHTITRYDHTEINTHTHTHSHTIAQR